MESKGDAGSVEKTEKTEAPETNDDKDADAATYASVGNEHAKSDNGSIEKIEHNEADDESYGSVEAAAGDETAESPATPKTTEEEKSDNPSELDEPVKGPISTTKLKVGARSSSVGGTREATAK